MLTGDGESWVNGHKAHLQHDSTFHLAAGMGVYCREIEPGGREWGPDASFVHLIRSSIPFSSADSQAPLPQNSSFS